MSSNTNRIKLVILNRMVSEKSPNIWQSVNTHMGQGANEPRAPQPLELEKATQHSPEPPGGAQPCHLQLAHSTAFGSGLQKRRGINELICGNLLQQSQENYICPFHYLNYTLFKRLFYIVIFYCIFTVTTTRLKNSWNECNSEQLKNLMEARLSCLKKGENRPQTGKTATPFSFSIKVLEISQGKASNCSKCTFKGLQ